MSLTRGLATTVAIISIACSLTACGGADARRATHMDRGQKFMAAGNYEKARVEFRNALQIAPNDVEARFMNATVAEKLGDLRGAAGLYQSAIDANPDHAKARANLGRMLVFGGGAQRALDVVAPAIAKHPDDADLLTVRGAARKQLKDDAGALEDAEHAVRVAPENENAVALLASLYHQSNQTDRSVELVKNFVQRHPDAVDLRQVLASLYSSQSQTDLAIGQLAKVVELRPKLLAHRVQLAMAYARVRKNEDAERVMREAAEVLTEDAKAKLAYVDYLVAQGARDRGEKALRDFIVREPKNFDLQLGLGSLQQRLGRADDAAATYRAIIAADDAAPAAISARNRIAAMDVANGKYDDALKLVDVTLSKNPRDNDALLLRSNISLARNNPSGAVADLRAVLRDQPSSVPVLRTLARAHLANGEPALAEESLRQAMDVAGADLGVRVELAQLLLQTKRGDQAVALLEKAVKASPADIPAREALVRAYLGTRDFAAARTAAEDLKLVAPNAAVGPFLAGVVAQAQNRSDEAVASYTKALEMQPNAMDALAAITRVDWERGQRERALARINKVVAADPKNAVARNLLGEMYLGDRNFALAQSTFEESVKIQPGWWLAWRNLALAQLGQNDKAGAFKTYEAGLVATKREPLLVAALAALYEREGRIDDAIHEYRALHDKNPRFEVAANNLAMLLVTYRKDRESLEQARALTEPFARSDSSALLDTHGWVMFKLGQTNEALPVLERAAEGAPESKVIRYHLGMAQFKSGMRDRAKDNLQQALKGAATFAGADEARATLASLTRGAG